MKHSYSAVQCSAGQFGAICLCTAIQCINMQCKCMQCSACRAYAQPRPLSWGISGLFSLQKQYWDELCTVHSALHHPSSGSVAAAYQWSAQKVFSVQCSILNVKGSVFSVQYIVFSVQSSLFSHKCSVFSVQCSVFSFYCSVFSVQCSVCIVQCSEFSVQW